MENKNKFKVAIFCILSGFLGITLGYASSFNQKNVTLDDNYKLILGTYQNYYNATEDILILLEESKTPIDSIKESTPYKDYIQLYNTIQKYKWQSIESNTKVLDDYYNYYHYTESLLDSLYEWNPDYFLDVVFETDAYYEYELFKEEIK